ncbi:MAG: hypothetical protein PHE50_00565 [Dehalococcoidales bacterium]|nr:hypothetical protein [Dehalococcoidales bacterium]
MSQDIEKFIDKVKAQTLYEYQNPDSLPQDMLKQWDTNSRYNEELAQISVAFIGVTSNFKGVFKGMFDDVMPRVVTVYRSLDGWSVTRAIEAEGMKTAKENVEKEEKGLLGKLGIG